MHTLIGRESVVYESVKQGAKAVTPSVTSWGGFQNFHILRLQIYC